jgi:predicted dehydrogenase
METRVSDPERPLKGILVGAGFFAQFHAEAWRRLDGASITAVCDVAPGRAVAFAAEYGIPRAYEDVEAMLDAERPEFVDLVTRPETHLPLGLLAAERGAHVICQKPMAPTLAECIAFCDGCERAGARLLIHENWRWQPWYREARRLIESGMLGELRHVAFDWRTGDGNGPEPFVAQPYFRRMPRLLIYESLVHLLDTFRFLAGELRVTDCETRRVNPVILGEDWAELQLRFEGGSTGFIHADRQTGPHPAPVAMGELRIEGERGSLRINGNGQLYWGASGQPEEKLPFVPVDRGYKGDSVFATQRHLIDCLRTGHRAESEGRDYLRTVALVEEAYSLANRDGGPPDAGTKE